MKFILLLFFYIHTIYASNKKFWITGQVKYVEWKKNCLTIDRCLQPRFQLAFYISEDNIASRVDSPIIERLHIKNRMLFNSYFEDASPNDLTVTASVIGVDSLFNVPVNCDNSNYAQAFSSFVLDSETVDVVLEGKCFRVFIDIEKYESECPWCPKENDVNNIKKEKIDDKSFLKSFIFSSDQNLLTIVLIFIVLLFCTLATILIILIIKQKPQREYSIEEDNVLSKTKIHNTMTTGIAQSSRSNLSSNQMKSYKNSTSYESFNYPSVTPPPISTIPLLENKCVRSSHAYDTIEPFDPKTIRNSRVQTWINGPVISSKMLNNKNFNDISPISTQSTTGGTIPSMGREPINVIHSKDYMYI
uniref:C2 domain-containing protein n=1 Tax=Parastrongyloides trichosuri TaxID=131310 RepID=A0A0N5A185_PARTI